MTDTTINRQSTGIHGLDEILSGGLIPGRAYLVSAGPGCGKTILGLHYLTNGLATGEKALFITLEESAERIRTHADSLGLDLQGVDVLDLSPDAEFFTAMQTYDLFSPAEVEREPIAQKIVEYVQRIQPQRVFLDSMSQFRYLSNDAFQFRKQVLSFLRFMTDHKVTVLFSSESSQGTPDDDMRFMSDGIIELALINDQRTVSVTKFRGSAFHRGTHAMRLDGQGMRVFPRLVPEKFRKEFEIELISSGVPSLDNLLHGGIERGTVSIVSGPSGAGKTTLGLQFMQEAAKRGERSVVYTFEEGINSIVHRCEAIGLPVRAMLEKGSLSIIPIEPLIYSPDEFASLVRQEAEENELRTVMIDSTAGYQLSFQDEHLESHLHSLCKYLKNMGTTVLLINETDDIISSNFRATTLGISYLADNIIYIRYVEIEGVMRKAIGVLKKRLSDFDKSVHPFEITSSGLKVESQDGLSGLQGLLSGNPDIIDDSQRSE
ncbi:MAG: circadian clock protein KaiC [Candidatus Latescibacterota bacterium]|jgi:circadian clock protein KaiC